MGNNPKWTLGRGFKMDDDFVGVREVVADTPCVNCADEYPGAELLGGWCFECRYERHLTRKVPLELIPSRGNEAGLIFPTGGI